MTAALFTLISKPSPRLVTLATCPKHCVTLTILHSLTTAIHTRRSMGLHLHRESIHQLFYLSTFEKKRKEGFLCFTPENEFGNQLLFLDSRSYKSNIAPHYAALVGEARPVESIQV